MAAPALESGSRWTACSTLLSRWSTRTRATRPASTRRSPARTEFWWNERKPDERTLWQSKVVLSHEFFHEIVFHPVPLDMNILKALRRSPLGLDLYVWLNYRTFGLGQPVRLTWPQLYRQFGINPANADDKNTVNSFRTKAPPRVEEDQVRLARPRLRDAGWRPRASAL